ncbi:MAG: hypothetical protein LUG56_02800 [Lachnospiraceae bacterium]|nr:hypothetical protein [Lachnospiraceae bacterium]
MKELVIFGTGDFSDVVSYVLWDKLGRVPAAYTVNRRFLTEPSRRGVPVAALEDLAESYPPENYEIVLGLIGRQMFDQRSEAAELLWKMGYHLANVVDPSAQVDTDALGEGNIILANVSVEHHCQIGSGNIIWQNVVLPHHNRVGDFNNLAPSVSLSGYSGIGSHCFIGNNACIKNRVQIGDYTYIGAGAYVASAPEPGSVLVPHRSYVLEGKSGRDFL